MVLMICNINVLQLHNQPWGLDMALTADVAIISWSLSMVLVVSIDQPWPMVQLSVRPLWSSERSASQSPQVLVCIFKMSSECWASCIGAESWVSSIFHVWESAQLLQIHHHFKSESWVSLIFQVHQHSKAWSWASSIFQMHHVSKWEAGCFNMSRLFVLLSIDVHDVQPWKRQLCNILHPYMTNVHMHPHLDVIQMACMATTLMVHWISNCPWGTCSMSNWVWRASICFLYGRFLWAWPNLYIQMLPARGPPAALLAYWFFKTWHKQSQTVNRQVQLSHLMTLRWISPLTSITHLPL